MAEAMRQHGNYFEFQSELTQESGTSFVSCDCPICNKRRSGRDDRAGEEMEIWGESRRDSVRLPTPVGKAQEYPSSLQS